MSSGFYCLCFPSSMEFFESCREEYGPDDITLEGLGHFFLELTEENYKGTKGLLKLQNEQRGHELFYDMQKPSQEEWDKTQEARKSSLVLEKNLSQKLWDVHSLGFTYTNPQLCYFLENHILNGEVKVTKNMNIHLTNHCRLVGQ
ncbi:ferritin light chain 1-like [Rattus norvegicus]|uniref:ferritin light chain 1-like n=1 Tax=Rattus norvegicus TaxID=10116 RepID=UPI0019178BA5|nr:ferritin light chain 1-like [Rattus norvegicus]